MSAGTIVLIVIAAIVVIYILRGIKIIPQSETRVVERLGKFDRVLSPGIQIIWPIIDKAKVVTSRKITNSAFGGEPIVKMTNSSVIDLREQVYDFPKQTVITKDNVSTQINALLYFQIVDAKKSVYEIDNLPNAIEKLTQTTLRNSKLRAVLDDATNKWGVKVNRVELQDITPPDSVRESMEMQMQAERMRRAEILRAEGEKKSAILKSEGDKASEINNAEAEKTAQILRAEGEAKAKVLQAEAEANAIRLVAEAVASAKTDPAAYMLAVKYIDTLKEMVSGKDNKTVYLPYEASNMLSSLGSIKDIFNK